MNGPRRGAPRSVVFWVLGCIGCVSVLLLAVLVIVGVIVASGGDGDPTGSPTRTTVKGTSPSDGPTAANMPPYPEEVGDKVFVVATPKGIVYGDAGQPDQGQLSVLFDEATTVDEYGGLEHVSEHGQWTCGAPPETAKNGMILCFSTWREGSISIFGESTTSVLAAWGDEFREKWGQ